MNGATPLDFTDIEAYKQATQTDLRGWEAQTIKNLSSAYVSQTYDRNATSKPPYYSEKIVKPMSSSNVMNAFAGIATVQN